jgi:hypothetical protein
LRFGKIFIIFKYGRKPLSAIEYVFINESISNIDQTYVDQYNGETFDYGQQQNPNNTYVAGPAGGYNQDQYNNE